MARASYIAVVGHEPLLEADHGAVSVLRGLGARVRAIDLWDDPEALLPSERENLRAIVVEAPERPDRAASGLRGPSPGGGARWRGRHCSHQPRSGRAARSGGRLDDFVLFPYVPAELYARIRNGRPWRRPAIAGRGC